MPDLNLDLNFRDHPKTRRFVAMLGKDTEWLVVKLWLHAGRLHPEGKLKDYSGEEIERLVEWGGTPGAFIEAMERVEWIKLDEKDAKKHYKLLGWKDHQGHLVSFKRRGRMAAKSRWDRYKQSKKRDASSIPQAMLKQKTSNAPTVRSGTNGDRSSISDEAWRKTLQSSEAYKDLNIETEFEKLVFWTQQRGRKATRRSFLNWLNRADKPMKPNPATNQQPSLKEYRAPEGK